LYERSCSSSTQISRAAHGREDRRARADDDARLAARDPLALVAALGLGQPEWSSATRRRSARGSGRRPAA
jgi:hypothetical protein